jgi:hypothetical protein
MSVAQAQSITDGSTSITDGSTVPERGAQAGKGNMSSALAVVRVEHRAEGIAAVVIEMQQSTGARRRSLQGEALKLAIPLLKRVVARFPVKVRGSLDPDDLLQIASIDALKVFDRYDHEARGRTTIEKHIAYSASRACEDQIAMQSADVNVSDDARRGRTKDRSPESIQVESRDATVTNADGVTAARTGLVEGESPKTPEELLLLKEVVRLLPRLERTKREYLGRYFGLEGYGAHQSEHALRQLAQDFGVSYTTMWRKIQQALAELRVMMEA